MISLTFTENCESRFEYDLEVEACVPVPRGYYRQQGVQDVGELCPVEFITPPGVGAAIADECSIGKSELSIVCCLTVHISLQFRQLNILSKLSFYLVLLILYSQYIFLNQCRYIFV